MSDVAKSFLMNKLLYYLTMYHLTVKTLKKQPFLLILIFKGGDSIKGYSRYINNYYNIKKYNDNYYKLTFLKKPIKNSGFEEEFYIGLSPEHLKAIKENQEYKETVVNEEKLKNNLVRARSKVFEYAISNDFDYFVTLTLDKEKYDRYNLSKYIKDLGQMIRNYRRDFNLDIQYILIPEQHKDGAWHMHGLINGLPLNQLVKNDNGYLEWPKYTKRFGYMSLGEIRDKLAVSKYITKYITKNMYNESGVSERNKKTYYASRGLKKAEKIKEGTLPFIANDSIPWNFENEYIKNIELSAKELEKILNILK